MIITREKLFQFLEENKIKEMEFDLFVCDYGDILNSKQIKTGALYAMLPHSKVSNQNPIAIEITLKFGLNETNNMPG